MRESFEIIEYNFEVLMGLAKGGYDFAHIWANYLSSVGWDEETYERELEKRIFDSSN